SKVLYQSPAVNRDNPRQQTSTASFAPHPSHSPKRPPRATFLPSQPILVVLPASTAFAVAGPPRSPRRRLRSTPEPRSSSPCETRQPHVLMLSHHLDL